MSRLESLDWLRGLLALSIMIYHLTGWKLYQPDSNELLGRLGIYGVSMFFILSGLAMAAGYANYIRGAGTAAKFFVRRIFRIWPLLWLAVASVTLGGVLVKGAAVDWPLVLLNITTVFGFISPGAYINTGAWSIGNEMVYYALTPIILAVYNRDKMSGNLLFAGTVAIAVYVAFFAMTPTATLASQWLLYINPFNNLCLYVAGVAIYYNAKLLKLSPPHAMLMMAASVGMLAAYPADGDLIAVVTGVNRLVFCLASVLIVLSFYKLTIKPYWWIGSPLAALGAATYGVYLLHPIVFHGVELTTRHFGLPNSALQIIAATSGVTIALSLFLYKWFESPLIQVGKRFTAGKINRYGAESRTSTGEIRTP